MQPKCDYIKDKIVKAEARLSLLKDLIDIMEASKSLGVPSTQFLEKLEHLKKEYKEDLPEDIKDLKNELDECLHPPDKTK